MKELKQRGAGRRPLFRTEFESEALHFFEGRDEGGRQRVLKRRTVFKVRPNKGKIEFKENRWGKETMKVTKEKADKFPRCRANVTDM